MYKRFLHLILTVFILFSATNVSAQITNVEEEKDLQFQTYFFEALKQKAIKNYVKAIENLELCEDIIPHNKAVAFEFSKNYFQLKKYFEAEIFINKALEKELDNAHLLKHKVRLLKAQRKFNEAIEIQAEIVKLKPRMAVDLVLLYIQNKQYNKAEKLIAELEKNALSSSKIKAFKRYLNSIKTKEQSIEVKEEKEISTEVSLQQLKKQYNNNKAYKNLIQLLKKALEVKDYTAILEASNEGMELYPAQPSVYIYNAKALNKLTKYNQAITVLSIGIDFVIDEPTVLLQFYNEYIEAYKGLNNAKEVEKYKLEIKRLKQKN